MRKRLTVGVILLAALVAGYLAMHRSDTSGLLRTVRIPGGYLAMAVDEQAGRLIVSSGGAGGTTPHGVVSVLDTRTGAVLAGRAVPLRTVGADCCPLRLAIDQRIGRVFVGSPGDNRLLLLDAHDGALLRIITLPSLFMAAAVDERRGHVVVLDHTGLSLLDARDGALLRRVPLRTRIDALLPMGIGIDEGMGRAVFTGFGDTRAFVVDTRDGRLLGAGAAGSNPRAIAVDERTARIFALDYGISGAGSTVRILDARTGALVGRVAVGVTPLAGDADVPTGRVFIANAARFSGAGSVSVLDGRTGRVLRAVAVGSTPVALAVDRRRERVYVVASAATNGAGVPTGAGSLVVLDGRNGTVLRRIALGVNPIAVAVDARAGHVFVLDAGGVVRVADPWGWMPRWLREHLPFGPAPRSGYRTVPSSVTMLDAAQ